MLFISQVLAGPLWLDAPRTGSFVFIARGIPKGMQAKLGEWSPIRIYRVDSNKRIGFRIEKCVRENNNISIVFVFTDFARVSPELEVNYFSKGEDGEVATLATVHEMGWTLTCLSGSTQEAANNAIFQIRFADSIDEIRESTSISITAPGWNWHPSDLFRQNGKYEAFGQASPE